MYCVVMTDPNEDVFVDGPFLKASQADARAKRWAESIATQTTWGISFHESGSFWEIGDPDVGDTYSVWFTSMGRDSYEERNRLIQDLLTERNDAIKTAIWALVKTVWADAKTYTIKYEAYDDMPGQGHWSLDKVDDHEIDVLVWEVQEKTMIAIDECLTDYDEFAQDGDQLKIELPQG